MAFNGLFSHPAGCFSLTVAHEAPLPALFGGPGILAIPFMSALTMGLGKSRIPACSSSKGKALVENVFNVFVHYFCISHAFFRAGLNGIWLHAAFFRKDRQQIFDPHNRDINCVATVLHVFFVGCPSAIIARVISIIVDSVNLGAFWSRAKVANKLPKVFTPFIADGNTPTPIVRARWIFRVIASLLHGTPRTVYWVCTF